LTAPVLDNEKVMISITYFRKIFSLVFVLFSLYLIRDAFFRWDGFKYYASLPEFIPSVALVNILWSIVALLTAVLVWLPVRTLEWVSLRRNWRINVDHFLFFMGVLVLSGLVFWFIRRKGFILPDTNIKTLQWKFLILSATSIAAFFITWFFRNKAGKIIDIVFDRITPLVWLFGFWLILSVPLVVYHAWIKQTDNDVSKKLSLTFPRDKSHPNIILVTFDAMTARDMSVYGYHRETTPFISEWAKKATLFTRAQAESNFTTPATASLMTGKRVWTHQTYHLRGFKPVRGGSESLPLLLMNNNYYNMAFIQNFNTTVEKLGISNSFNIAPLTTEFNTPGSLYGIIDKLLYQMFGDKIREYNWIIKSDFILHKVVNIISRDYSITSTPPENVFNRFLWIIDNNPPEPYFAWLHLMPPHDPYLPTDLYKGMFDSSPRMRAFISQDEIIGKFRHKNYPPDLQPVVDILRARYDEFMRYCDKRFEEFIEQLAKRDKLKNTVIILSSDHGESFEHNYLQHRGIHLYEQVTHIPLVLKEPGQVNGLIVDDLVEQVDIPPTILDIARIPVPSWMEGRSLIPLIRGENFPQRPAFSMNLENNPSQWHQINKGTIAVWEGNYKLIHYLEEEKSLLFNLKNDPDELNNLFSKEPDKGLYLLSIIRGGLQHANERIGRGQ
jgi:arylsulfatase A-like enzyme